MDYIEASEDSFGRANNYYILMWVMTALIVVTAFLDFRTHRVETETNQQIIDFYRPLESDAARLAQELRSFAYLAPGFETERQAIDAIRRQRSELIAKIRGIGDLMLENRSLTNDQRVAINKPKNQIGALLLLNDGTDQVGEFPHIPDTEQLLLAEHSPGSYLLADTIPELRVEDAVRYHWLATLGIPAWLEAFEDLESVLREDVDLAEHIEALNALHARTMSPDFRSVRAFSQKVWTTWIKSPQDADTEEEERRRKRLTLIQTSQFLEQAQARKVQLNLRATGQTSTVTIPVISIPLQLRDAILVAPLILIFCALAIATYTLRALRYAPETKVENTVVGNLPGYYAFYGFNKWIGIGVAIVLLLGPLLVLLFVLPVLIPVVLEGWDWKAVVYFASCFGAFIFLVVPLSMIPRVIDLMERRIVILSHPASGFPDFSLQRGPAGLQSIGTTTRTAIVPSQFVGCWKIQTDDAAAVFYLRIEADGRYLISDGKRTFKVAADGTTLTWDVATWARLQGSGKTIEGVWEQSPDVLTVAADLSTTIAIPGVTLPGLMDTYGDNAGGDILYFEQRATIVSVADFGNGTYEASLQSIFGGASTFEMMRKNDVMIFTMPNGDIFKFDSVDCSSLN
jgi:hypothetical protein